jgi:hypothetical protein
MQRGGNWRPIGAVLVESGAIDEAQLQAALAEQKTSGRRLGEILIDSGAITWNALAHAIAAQVEALDTDDGPRPAPQAAAPPTPAAARAPAPPPVSAPGAPATRAPAQPAIPAVPKVDVASGNRMETLETMLRERQRAFLELVATTETLRRAVAKLQDEVAEKEAEIKRLRLQTVA